jgi:hypothetical protein
MNESRGRGLIHQALGFHKMTPPSVIPNNTNPRYSKYCGQNMMTIFCNPFALPREAAGEVGPVSNHPFAQLFTNTCFFISRPEKKGRLVVNQLKSFT